MKNKDFCGKNVQMAKEEVSKKKSNGWGRVL